MRRRDAGWGAVAEDCTDGGGVESVRGYRRGSRGEVGGEEGTAESEEEEAESKRGVVIVW